MTLAFSKTLLIVLRSNAPDGCKPWSVFGIGEFGKTAAAQIVSKWIVQLFRIDLSSASHAAMPSGEMPVITMLFEKR